MADKKAYLASVTVPVGASVKLGALGGSIVREPI
tara:strand:+ start:1265 stop:1366 length:102 start_codon:yes stop_codon:yes gene_type:complete